MEGRESDISLLLAACSTTVTEPSEALLKEWLVNADWERLVQLAYTHGVAGQLCSSLLQFPTDFIPEEILSAAQAHLKQLSNTNQQNVDQLLGMLKKLEVAGVEAIPFKGPVLSATLYDDCKLRSFRDLDFLVRDKDIQSTLSALRAMGYVNSPPNTPKREQEFLLYSGQDILFGSGVPVEPHWALVPRTLSLDIDYPGLWYRSVQKSFSGQRIMAFTPEDELIILCCHGSKEKWLKLKWVVDVAEYLKQNPSLDWPTIIGRAKAQGLQRITLLGLGLAQYLLDAPLPRQAVCWMDEDPFAQERSRRLSVDFFVRPEVGSSVYEVSRFHWDMRDSVSDRWRYLFCTIIQPRKSHFDSIDIPDRFFFLYTPYKIIHDYFILPVWKQVKRVRSIVGNNKKS